MANATPLIWVYILRCADGLYYVGSYQGEDLETRIAEHNDAKYPNAFTASRRPVICMWAEEFSRYDDAIAFERQLKGWSRRKKEAVINGEWSRLPALSRNRQTQSRQTDRSSS